MSNQDPTPIVEEDPILGLSDEDRAALKAKYEGQKLYAAELPDNGTSIVFRKPTEAEYSPMINGKLDKAADRKTALTQLAMKVVVSPAKDALVALFSEYPGLSTRIASQAMSVASGEGAANAKKL